MTSTVDRTSDRDGALREGSATPPPSSRSRLPGSTLVRHILLMLAALVGVVLMLESTDAFRNSQFAAMSYFAIAAAGLTVLTGVNGQISLGHGALMAVGAYTTALLTEAEVMPLPVVFVVAVLVTALLGVVVGAAAARLHGPYLAGATLALAVALPGLAIYFNEVLGGEQGLRVSSPRAPEWLDSLFSTLGSDLSNSKYLAYIGWLALLVTLLLLSNLIRSRVGRTWRAVRDDEVAAELAGINLGRARVQAFVVSAGCAGLAGAVLAIVVRLAAPSAFTIVLSLSLLTAIVVGGLGSLVGALLGSAVLVFLPQLVTDFGLRRGLDSTEAAQLAPFIYGVVLIVVMLVAPAGLVGTVRRKYLERKARRAMAASSG